MRVVLHFSGIALSSSGYAAVAFFIDLPAMQFLLTTHKWVDFSQASPQYALE